MRVGSVGLFYSDALPLRSALVEQVCQTNWPDKLARQMSQTNELCQPVRPIGPIR